MKHLYTLTLALLLVAPSAFATVRTVSNNPQIPAAFTTIEAAIAASSAGDTIYVVGSPTKYSASHIQINKRIVLIGSGYYLAAAQNINTNGTDTDYIDFAAGSDGSIVIGFYVYTFTINDYVSNVTITHCAAGETWGNNGYSSLSIGQNCTSIYILQSILNSQIYLSGGGNQNNILIKNCFTKSFSNAPITATGIVYDQCRMKAYYAAPPSYNIIYNAVISNSIIEDAGFGGNSSFVNNIFNNAAVVATNGNQINVPINTVILGGSGNPDVQEQLKPGSPAIGAGTSGQDIGPFGGTTPYVLSGIPSIPAVTGLTIPGSASTTLPVNVKFRSNN